MDFVDEGTAAERYERGCTFFEAGDYVTASRLLAPVVSEEPGHLASRLLLARAYYHSAQLGRAEEQLREILARHPGEAYAYLMLGRVLQRQSRAAEAQGVLRMASAMGLEVELPRGPAAEPG